MKLNPLQNFQLNEGNADLMAEKVFEAYKPQVEAYENSAIKAKIGESVSSHDIVALGQQLAAFDSYKKFTESTNNLGALGKIPQVATDVIVAANANSIIPLLASTQPISEEHSIVYYKDTYAAKDMTGYTAGESINQPFTRDNVKAGTAFAGASRYRKELGKTTADQKVNLTANLKGLELPIRPGTLEVFIDGVGMAKDNGQGQIIGFKLDGEVNYQTGKITLASVENAPHDVKSIMGMWDVDTDSAAALPKIQSRLLTKDVRAEIYALSTDVGAFASYAFSKRFGSAGMIEAAQDLTNEMTRILNTRAVLELATNVPAQTKYAEYFRKAPTGVSLAEHKLGFVDAVAQAETLLHKQSGANAINRMIVGATAATVLRGMPDFVQDENASRQTVGLFGFYDGVPVIRASGIVADDEIVCLNNSDASYFNSPLVYAPYMPLMMTNTVQSVDNPFRSTQAAGVWSAFAAVNSNLTTKIVLKDAQPS